MAIDILPFPSITSTKPEEQIAQIIDYLAQFKEDLEFILDALQAGETVDSQTIEKAIAAAQTNTLSVSDVIGSYAFKNALSKAGANLSIDYETGHIQYE